jgi:hypothetical protein
MTPDSDVKNMPQLIIYNNRTRWKLPIPNLGFDDSALACAAAIRSPNIISMNDKWADLFSACFRLIAVLLAFVDAGLGKSNGGMDGGAIIPTSLCKPFLGVGLAS